MLIGRAILSRMMFVPRLLRIDMYILSRAKRICVAGPELTVPFEENLLKRHHDKLEKYQADFTRVEPGWSLELMVLEVWEAGAMSHRHSPNASRGWVSRPLSFVLYGMPYR